MMLMLMLIAFRSRRKNLHQNEVTTCIQNFSVFQKGKAVPLLIDSCGCLVTRFLYLTLPCSVRYLCACYFWPHALIELR
jgi:hypothetical protein